MNFRVLKLVITIVIASIVLIYPVLGNKYLIYVMTSLVINIMVAICVNLLIGYTGQVSLGQAAFLAVGTYSAVIFSGMLRFPFPLVLVISGTIAGILGLGVGLPALRLRGLYLAVATLAFHVIIIYFIRNTSSLGGSGGILVGEPILWAGHTIRSYSGTYYIALASVIATYIAVRNIIMSKDGRAIIAVRDQEIVAMTLGIEVSKYKLKAFIISSFITGVAGSIYGFNLQFVDPEHFTIETAVLFIGMAVVGGMGTKVGPILGGVFFTLFPEIIRVIRPGILVLFPKIVNRFEDIFVIADGLIIVLFLMYMPRGLAGLLQGRTMFSSRKKKVIGGERKGNF